MRLVVIESPYEGEVTANVAYARKCMKDCLNRKEAPFASHLLYTQQGILNDAVFDERQQGIQAGFAWREFADVVAFYLDRGVSGGMRYAFRTAMEYGLKIEFRCLDRDVAMGDLLELING